MLNLNLLVPIDQETNIIIDNTPAQMKLDFYPYESFASMQMHG